MCMCMVVYACVCLIIDMNMYVCVCKCLYVASMDVIDVSASTLCVHTVYVYEYMSVLHSYLDVWIVAVM